jgi:alkyl sulfatase BDS1-like metallo-beta-lactamase superfamily hydrolase
VHEEALKGFNAGVDMWTLMDKIQLPPELRVGQGYGKVSWAVRTFWEEYVGWFKLESTTEFYPDSSPAALAELLVLTGTDAALDRAEAALARGNAPLALTLGEAIAQTESENPRLRSLMANAHQHLLDNGGDVSFWENGWLRTELARWSEPGS